MSGFKKFLLQGNLVELAVAFVIGGAFATVVKAMVAVIMDLIGKAGGTPNFSTYAPKGIHVGDLLTAAVGFVILAAVVYFGVVMPYTKAKERFFPDPVTEEGVPADIALLSEIRDALQAKA
jgi:large conductance mechanosensitive channel